MSYSTGMMRDRVTILVPEREDSRTGARTGYRKGRTLWAGVTWAKGVRALRNGEVTAYDTVMVRTRFAADLTAHCRLLWCNRYFVIDSVYSDFRENTTQITATEVAPFNVKD